MKKVAQTVRDSIRYMWQAPFTGGAAFSGTGTGIQTVFDSIFGQNPTLLSILNTLFQVAIVVGAILAVSRLIYGGFIYTTRDMWSSKQRAVTIIQQAVIGLLLLLAVYLVLFQINPQILDISFTAKTD